MQLLSVMPACKKSHSIPTKMAYFKEEQNAVPEKQKQVKFLRSFAPPLMAAIVALLPLCNPPVSLGQLTDTQRGATLFHQACIGCHDGGGNIIQPGATLFLQDLQRNGVDAEEEIYRITYYGNGRMPVLCRALGRNAHQGASVHLGLGCRMKKSSFWQSL
ncbi:hypothetical protein NE237_008257 [Protea cynaroides]|uniref:Cytochrome c-553 n=1 Tax=Protea cynaroides TaxID=273540 RepID=A0A9Q0GJY9_9MAGN|nr:hypothetical protein NE237_008257 [Protea cynaroides]